MRTLLKTLAFAAVVSTQDRLFAQPFGFSSPNVLNTNAASDSGGDFEPQVASDGAGHWIAIWISNDSLSGTIGTDNDVLISHSFNNGSTWTPPQALNSYASMDSDGDFTPRIAYGGSGRWVAVWVSNNSLGGTKGTDPDILVSHSSDNGMTWTPAAALNSNAFSDFWVDGNPQIATDRAGNWIVAWESSNEFSTGHNIYISRSTDGGATWSGAQGVSTPSDAGTINDTDPSIATDRLGAWVVVWQYIDSHSPTIYEGEIFFTRSTDNGVTWSEPSPLNTNAATDDGFDAQPRITTDGMGSWITVWASNESFGGTTGGDWEILYARSTDGGAHWTDPHWLNSDAESDSRTDLSPQIASDGLGNWIVVWEAADTAVGSDRLVLVSRSTDAGETWAAPAALSTVTGLNPAVSIHPQVAAGVLGHWIIAWPSANLPGVTIGPDVDILVSISTIAAPVPTCAPDPTPFPVADGVTLDYTQSGGDTRGWTSGVPPGFGGSAFVSAGGLCMSVPGPGINFSLWSSPERFLELQDGMIYRVRLAISTDQVVADAIPLFFVAYDNFNACGEGNNYGGFYWVLDVDGGAEGIGRAQGRTSYDFYVAPNAINTPQWINQAFLPAADAENDIRLQYRVIDANATLLSDNDSGTICISSVEITAIARASLMVDQIDYAPPISSATHFAEANGEVGVGGTGVIDDTNRWARYQIATTGDNRKTLGPFNPTAGVDLNTQLYPVAWEANRLFRIKTRIRAESSESDPVDAIFVSMDTTTQELGMSVFTTRGAPGGAMDKAASPKLAAAEYEGYFYSHNATASMTPNAGRLRPLAFFFNTTDQGGDGTGGDAFIVESLDVEKLVTPP